MDIPGDFVEDRFEHVDGYEAYASFDQAPGQQASLAEAIQAVTPAHVFGFLIEIKRLARFGGSHRRYKPG